VMKQVFVVICKKQTTTRMSQCAELRLSVGSENLACIMRAEKKKEEKKRGGGTERFIVPANPETSQIWKGKENESVILLTVSPLVMRERENKKKGASRKRAESMLCENGERKEESYELTGFMLETVNGKKQKEHQLYNGSGDGGGGGSL